MEVKSKEERKIVKSAKRSKEGSRAASSLMSPIGNMAPWDKNLSTKEQEQVVQAVYTGTKPVTPDEESSKRKERASLLTSLETEEGDGWDTDLEDVRFPSRKSLEPDQKPRVVYIRACRKFNITPSSKYLKGLKEGHINLANQGLGPLGTKAVALSLAMENQVEDLILSGNSMGETGIKYISEMLWETENILHVNLSDNSLGSYGAKAIGEMLERNDGLQTLNLSGNNFGVHDCTYLMEPIASYRCPIKELDLSHNCLGDDGARIIASAIEANDTLAVLDISWNNLKLKGALAIADGLQENTSIRSLNLSWNGIGDSGLKAILSAAVANETLEKLSVDGNRITPEGLPAAMHILRGNKTLKEIKLNKNPMSCDGPMIVLHTVKAHPDMGLVTVEFKDIWINKQVSELLEEVHQIKPNFHLKHGGFISAQDIIKHSLKKRQTDTLNDPFMFLIKYVTENKLRWLDLFNRMDTDKNFSLSRQEFKDGVKAAGIPLNDSAVNSLVERLDADGNGEIDFGELLEGQKKYTKRLEKIIGKPRSRPPSSQSRATSRPSSRQRSRPVSRESNKNEVLLKA